MTELSAIFRNKPATPSQSTNNRSFYNSQNLSVHGSSNKAKTEFPYFPHSNGKANTIDNDLIISREAKKIVSMFNMQK